MSTVVHIRNAGAAMRQEIEFYKSNYFSFTVDSPIPYNFSFLHRPMDLPVWNHSIQTHMVAVYVTPVQTAECETYMARVAALLPRIPKTQVVFRFLMFSCQNNTCRLLSDPHQ